MAIRFNKRNTVNAAIIIAIVSTVILYARSDGIVGTTLKNGNGCNCHSSSPSSNVSVTISGPDTLSINQTATYTVTISGGSLVRGGTNIAASSGNLQPLSGDLRKEANELTHTAPKSPVGGQVTFQFNYTAPLSPGTQTLFANGNSVNFNGSNSGDQWNFASNKSITVLQPTGIDDEVFANSFRLNQNYPNPFNPSTKISWQTAVGSNQTLKVYDIIGNLIAVLVDGWKEAGHHSIDFDAANLPSGVYLYELRVNNFALTKKMLLQR